MEFWHGWGSKGHACNVFVYQTCIGTHLGLADICFFPNNNTKHQSKASRNEAKKSVVACKDMWSLPSLADLAILMIVI
jgi:hypothetical protein